MAEYAQTVQEIIDIVLTALRSDTGNLAKLFQQTLNEFNAATAMLNSLHRWNFNRKEGTVAVVQGNRVLLLPVDCIALEKVNVNVNGTYRVLSEISQDEYKIAFPSFIVQGSPSAYASGPYDVSSTAVPPKKTIMIGPTSDGAYSLELTYDATIKVYTIANYTEIPPVPQYVLPCLIALVTSKMLVFTKAPSGEIDRAEARFGQLLSAAKRYDTGFNRKTSSMRLSTEIANYRAGRLKV